MSAPVVHSVPSTAQPAWLVVQEDACALAKRKVATTDPNTNRSLVTLMNQNAESAESADSVLVALLFSELNVRYHPTVQGGSVAQLRPEEESNLSRWQPSRSVALLHLRDRDER